VFFPTVQTIPTIGRLAAWARCLLFSSKLAAAAPERDCPLRRYCLQGLVDRRAKVVHISPNIEQAVKRRFVAEPPHRGYPPAVCSHCAGAFASKLEWLESGDVIRSPRTGPNDI
jgi:hypothetical protein